MVNQEIQSDEIEINLYELWVKIRRGWKLTLFLFVITIVCAGVYTSRLPKVYQINATITLGRDSDGKPLANLNDVLALVKQGSLNGRIISKLNLNEQKYASRLSSDLKAEAGKNSELMYLHYATADPETGKKIISTLVQETQSIYASRAEKNKKALDSETRKIQEQITSLKWDVSKINSDIEEFNKKANETSKEYVIKTNIIRMQEDSTRKHITNLTHRISLLREAETNLEKTIKMLEENTRELLKAKKDISSDNPKGAEILSNIIYANNMQQNLALIDDVYARRKKYTMEINNVQSDILKLNADLSILDEKIKQSDIEKEKKIAEYNYNITQLTLQKNYEIPSKRKQFEAELSVFTTQQEQIENIGFAIPPDYINVPADEKKKTLVIAGLLALFAGCLISVARQKVS